MKNFKLLVLMAAASIGLVACSDDMDEGRIIVSKGEEISFTASDLASFGDGYSNTPQTRTAYGDATYDESAGLWHYPLNWVYGDGISIYCTATNQDADYTIQWEGGTPGAESPANTHVELRVGDDEPLKWGDPDTEHKFYAFYPTSVLKRGTFTNGILKGSISNVQDPVEIVSDGKGNYIAKPNMENAFMRAEYSVKPKDSDGTISLEFKPLTTAIDIKLTASDNVGADGIRLSQIQVEATDGTDAGKQAVCGDFTYDIDRNIVTIDNDYAANDYMISISLWKGDNPLVLKAGQSVTFTVFLLPGNNHSDDPEHTDRTVHNLRVRVPTWENYTATKTYGGIDIEVGTKSQIVLPKLEIPTSGGGDYQVNEWMKSIEDRVYVSQLSIPGSANAFTKDFSKDTYNGKGTETTQTQEITVEEQFAVGVRAFEIGVERADPYGLNGGDDTKKNLKDAPLNSGGDNGLKFEDAMNRLVQLVKDNPSEFVVVMPYYSYNEKYIPEYWCKQLKNFLQNYEPGVPIKAYTNGLTVGDVRGSILFLSRMPSDKNTVDGWVGKPEKTSAIYGWNSDKDRWERRGYDMSASGYWTTISDYNFPFWNGNKDPKGAGYTDPTLENWAYDAATPSSGAAPTFYVQDWYRVAEETTKYSGQQWYESKTEKLKNFNDFMTATIGYLKGNPKAETVFINSLAGYYVGSTYNGRPNDAESYHPYPDGSSKVTLAKRGDVPAYASDMNAEVYKFVNNLTDATRGPLGIVLINYANVNEFKGMSMYGEYIVHSLIDNNFRIMMTGSDSQSSNN